MRSLVVALVFALVGAVLALNCGDTMTKVNGVEARYNTGQPTSSCCAGDSPTGCRYQCVELAQRYFFEMYGIPPMWAVRGAIDMCHQHPPGVSQVNAADAGPGDLYVMSIPNDSFGHVAVVTAIDHSKGVVHVVEQNWSNTGVNTHPLSSAACFLRGGK
jgi:hypothetical protein